jgi:hypothetical protein
MPIQHPQFGSRELKPEYLYTTAQINDVGAVWQRGSANRLFCPTEKIGEIGLTPELIPHGMLEHLPFEILCPINQGGNHWTSFAIQVTAHEGRLQVHVGYSDSLSRGQTIPAFLKPQLDNIRAIFTDIDPGVEFKSEAYAHRWMQSDHSSCGPFSLANAWRFFQGSGASDNPGREVIREAQLLMMTTSIAITGCSTSNKLDEILMNWLLSGGNTKQITADTIVEMICAYATSAGEEFADVDQFVRKELNMSTTDNYFTFTIKARIGQLSKQFMQSQPPAPAQKPALTFKRWEWEMELTRPTALEDDEPAPVIVSPDLGPLETSALEKDWDVYIPLSDLDETVYKTEGSQHPTIQSPLNCIGHIREAIFLLPIQSHDPKALLVNVLGKIYQGHESDAVTLLAQSFGDQPLSEACTESILRLSEIKEEWRELGEVCTQLHEVSEILHQSTFKITHHDVSQAAYEAHIQLLINALERQEAGRFKKILYVISDFCSKLLKFFSGGTWTPDYEKINAVKAQLKDNALGFFKKSQLIDQIEGELDICIQTMDALARVNREFEQVNRELEQEDSTLYPNALPGAAVT